MWLRDRFGLVERLGRLPAVPVALGFWLAVVTIGALLTRPTESFVGLPVVVVFIAYCFARPAGGWDVFLMTIAPSAIGEIAHDLTGVPDAWVGVPVAALMLMCLAAQDKEDRQALSVRGSGSDAPMRIQPE